MRLGLLGFGAGDTMKSDEIDCLVPIDARLLVLLGFSLFSNKYR
jgi:hypothetical protein